MAVFGVGGLIQVVNAGGGVGGPFENSLRCRRGRRNRRETLLKRVEFGITFVELQL